MVEIRAPFVANIDITNRCNLKCIYCYASGRGNIDIPAAKCIDLINELIDDHGVFHVTIAGGEPLLHPGILRIIEESFLRHGDRLVLLSNGTHLLNEHFFTQFSAICHDLNRAGKLLEIQISMDSHVPEVHNRNRDGGHQVIAAVEKALTLPIILQLACVVTRNNVDCAHQIIEAYYPRVKNFHYMNVMPSIGRSQGGTYWDLLPTKKQIQVFHQRILDIEKHYQPIRITKIVRECDKEGGTLRAKGCLAGTTRIDIAPDLTVHACCMSNEVLGSLATQSFSEMWNSPQAERIREVEKPYCFKWC